MSSITRMQGHAPLRGPGTHPSHPQGLLGRWPCRGYGGWWEPRRLVRGM